MRVMLPAIDGFGMRKCKSPAIRGPGTDAVLEDLSVAVLSC